MTKSPCRFQVAASLSAATSSSSACALAGGQARSSIGPATKITVLPATENWPLPPLHHSSSDGLAIVADLQVRHPLRSGLARGVQRHRESERKVVFGARRDGAEARPPPATSATAAAPHKTCQLKTCNPSKSRAAHGSARRSMGECATLTRLAATKIYRLAKQIPAGAIEPRGFSSVPSGPAVTSGPSR